MYTVQYFLNVSGGPSLKVRRDIFKKQYKYSNVSYCLSTLACSVCRRPTLLLHHPEYINCEFKQRRIFSVEYKNILSAVKSNTISILYYTMYFPFQCATSQCYSFVILSKQTVQITYVGKISQMVGPISSIKKLNFAMTFYKLPFTRS